MLWNQVGTWESTLSRGDREGFESYHDALESVNIYFLCKILTFSSYPLSSVEKGINLKDNNTRFKYAL